MMELGIKKLSEVEIQCGSVDQVIDHYTSQLKSKKDYYSDLLKETTELRSTKVIPSLSKEDLDLNYKLDLQLLEKDRYLSEYKIKLDDFECKLHSLIISAINEKAELSLVPEKYRGKVESKAMENGHSSGYSGYYNALSDLIDLFV